MVPGLVDQWGEPIDTLPPPMKPKEKPCPDGKVKDAAGNCVDKPCSTFENRIKQVIDAEGGFVNALADSGGATDKGIAWKTWKENAKSVLGVEPTLDNLKNLTDAQAQQIYRHEFWDAISADQINDGDVRYLLFDFTVNSGKGNAVMTLQRVLNGVGFSLKVDGGMGEKTLNSLNNANQLELYTKLKKARIDFIENIPKKKPSQKKFMNGWLNRIRKFNQKDKEHMYNVNCN